MRINSVPDVKCFCNNKNVLRAQSMVWHFVRHPVLSKASEVLVYKFRVRRTYYFLKVVLCGDCFF